MKIREALQWFEESSIEEFAKYLLLRKVMRELGVEDIEGDASIWNGPRIEFWASKWDETKTFRAYAKLLLPKVGAFQKRFDEKTNTFELFTDFNGVRLSVRGAPPETCKVVQVVEEVEIPATEARIEKKTSYRLEGDCDPLMNGETEEESNA